MRRALGTVLTAGSLLPILAIAALWVRSYFVSDLLYAIVPEPLSAWQTIVNLGSERGGLYYLRVPHRDRSEATESPRVERGWMILGAGAYPGSSPTWREPLFDFAGSKLLRRHEQSTGRRGEVPRVRTLTYFGWVVPYWVVTLVAAVPPALLAARWQRQARRQHRLRHGLCPRCGYDLRAGTGDPCPECGEAVPAAC